MRNICSLFFHYTFNGNGSNPIKTAVTDVRGITDYNINASVHPTRSWSDGPVSSIQRSDLGRTKVYKTEATDWEQDIPSISYKWYARRQLLLWEKKYNPKCLNLWRR
jgi:hypothetical protein